MGRQAVFFPEETNESLDLLQAIRGQDLEGNPGILRFSS